MSKRAICDYSLNFFLKKIEFTCLSFLQILNGPSILYPTNKVSTVQRHQHWKERSHPHHLVGHPMGWGLPRGQPSIGGGLGWLVSLPILWRCLEQTPSNFLPNIHDIVCFE